MYTGGRFFMPFPTGLINSLIQIPPIHILYKLRILQAGLRLIVLE